MAQRTGLAADCISKIMDGRTKQPNSETLRKLHGVFKTSADDVDRFSPEKDAIAISKNTLIAFLKSYRIQYNLTNTEMARRCNIAVGTYGRFLENRDANYQMGTLQKICEGLGVRPRDISDFGQRLTVAEKALKSRLAL